ncbi:MAG: hypothetical protein AAGF48_16055, partial [Pseudomonadota bacterium]
VKAMFFGISAFALAVFVKRRQAHMPVVGQRERVPIRHIPFLSASVVPQIPGKKSLYLLHRRTSFR